MGNAGEAPQGWQARLALGFEDRGGRTVLVRGERRGPLQVQRPFYPEDGACHVYILHPPGGVAGGDRLDIRVAVGQGAGALLTTPAATKVYRSREPCIVDQRLQVHAGASLEWLPQETILYGGSRMMARTEMHVAVGARLAAWEIVALGRPASGDMYAAGQADLGTRVFVDGEPRLIERHCWRRGARVLAAPWGLGGARVLGTLYVYPGDGDGLARTRKLVAAESDVLGGATVQDDVLVLRVLAADAAAVRRVLDGAWSRLRWPTLRMPPCPPRIWAT